MNNTDMKKLQLQKLINKENGINYHRNVDLSGYTVYRGDSFISFRFVEIKGFTTVIIDYIYVTNKNDLLKLFSWCLNFWSGNAAKFIYYKEHKRKSNVVKKYLPLLGFKTQDATYTKWKHDWTSTNGYDESEIIESFIN
jgi:hypothetical protein